jgi:hypothetical protein
MMAEQGDVKVEPAYKPLATLLTYISPIHCQPWDEAGIRRIREFDPGFVPIFRTRIYQTKAGALLYFSHHGVARYGKNTQPDPAVLGALRPVYGYFSRFPGGNRPNFIERWFENEQQKVPGSIRQRYNLPAPFVRWGPWVERWVEETFWAASAREKQAFHDATHAESGAHIDAHREWEHEQSEAAYRQQGETPYQKRLHDSMGVDDEKEAMARAAGLWEEPTRPSVDMGGSAA